METATLIWWILRFHEARDIHSGNGTAGDKQKQLYLVERPWAVMPHRGSCDRDTPLTTTKTLTSVIYYHSVVYRRKPAPHGTISHPLNQVLPCGDRKVWQQQRICGHGASNRYVANLSPFDAPPMIAHLGLSHPISIPSSGGSRKPRSSTAIYSSPAHPHISPNF